MQQQLTTVQELQHQKVHQKSVIHSYNFFLDDILLTHVFTSSSLSAEHVHFVNVRLENADYPSITYIPAASEMDETHARFQTPEYALQNKQPYRRRVLCDVCIGDDKKANTILILRDVCVGYVPVLVGSRLCVY